ncbi:MAG: ACT domain-containing protein [Peptococcaceae bacterium]
MSIKQLSVFLENEPGRLRSVTSILAQEEINIRALSLADSADFGVIRLIVDKPDWALEVLKKKNFPVKATEVIAVEMSDTPGGLDNVLEILENLNVNIEYMYAFMGSKPRKALVIFRVDHTTKAVKGLAANNVNLVSTEEQIADLIYYCWD